MRYIETFKDGDRISEVYLCKSKSSALTKAGKEYENVILIDKTGQIQRYGTLIQVEYAILKLMIMYLLMDRLQVIMVHYSLK